jgi:hypothetical protein
VILAVTLRLLGLGPRSFAHDLANTSLTEWVRPSSGPWLLHRFNDAAHLDATHLDATHREGVHLDAVHLAGVHLDSVHRPPG